MPTEHESRGRWNRREFMALTAAAALPWPSPASAAGVPRHPQPGAPEETDIKLSPDGVMPTRRLGKTGVSVSLLGLGGFHLGLPPREETAIRIVRTAIEHGVTFMDNCWDYNNGESQVRMGHALRDGYRQKVFLMTKIDGRTRKAAKAQIEQCLRSLGTDVIDLVQIHEVIRITDPGRVFGPDGAIEALVAAKKEGKIRFIGFTGHKSPDIHLEMLKTSREHGFRFDTVQMPLNVMDAHSAGFQYKVLPELVEREIGILGMKPLGSGLFLQSAPLLTRQISPSDCLQYAMNLQTSVVITGCETVAILKQAIDAAFRFKPKDDEWVKRILEKTATVASGAWEKYKNSETFDGTTKHPWWLETSSLSG